MVEDAIIQEFKCDILSNFQTIWTMIFWTYKKFLWSLGVSEAVRPGSRIIRSSFSPETRMLPGCRSQWTKLWRKTILRLWIQRLIYYWQLTHYSKSQIFVQKFNFDKTPTFSRVFHPKFFLTIFLVKSKLSSCRHGNDRNCKRCKAYFPVVTSIS